MTRMRRKPGGPPVLGAVVEGQLVHRLGVEGQACRAEPLTSMRMAFLRPVANRVASKEPSAPPGRRAGEQRGVVHGDLPRHAVRRARGQARAAPAGSGRLVTKVSVSARDARDPLPGEVLGERRRCARRGRRARRTRPAPAQPPGQRGLGVDQPVLQVLRTARAGSPPTRPSATSRRASAMRGHPAVVEGHHRPHARARRPPRPPRSSASASATVLASGFSHSTCLPAASAASAISAWLSPGVQMSTRSMSARSTSVRQSVSALAQPCRSAASRHGVGVRARRARPAPGSAAGRRTGPAVRQACECAAPMKA